MQQYDGDRAKTLYGGEKRHRLTLPRLSVTYAWMQPFEGASRTRPNRLEVVFSRHRRVALEQADHTYDVDVAAGAFYVIGDEPTTLLNVPEHSDTLEMYPNMGLVEQVAGERGTGAIFRPTLGQRRGDQHFEIDGVMLGVAHVLRVACLGQRELSPMEASTLEHLLVDHMLGGERSAGRLTAPALRRVVDRVEDELDRPLTLDDLASEAHLSAFHFARAFKRSTGLAPHRYVLARKMDHVKRCLLTTKRPVEQIAQSVGFENLNHFRRQFRSQFGVTPGAMRSAARD